MKMMQCNHAGAGDRCDPCSHSILHECGDCLSARCTPGHMEIIATCKPVAEPVEPPVDPPPCPNCEALKEQLLDARRQVLNCEALKEQHSKAVNAATIAVLEIEKQARKKTEAAYADAHRALAEVEDVLREALRHVEGTRQDTWDTLRSATKGGERGQD